MITTFREIRRSGILHWKILEKRRIKILKNEEESFQLFMENTSRLQVLITEFSILSYHENVVFILIYGIFPKI